MSTDKKSFFVDAKRVIGMQCNGQSKKEKMINSGLKKTTQKTEIMQVKTLFITLVSCMLLK
jgi:hypothetical protein